MSCNSSMAGCEYYYEEVSRNISTTQDGRTFLHVNNNIGAVCPKCGLTKSFMKKFTCGPGENIQYKVDSYCRSVFKH